MLTNAHQPLPPLSPGVTTRGKKIDANAQDREIDEDIAAAESADAEAQ